MGKGEVRLLERGMIEYEVWRLREEEGYEDGGRCGESRRGRSMEIMVVVVVVGVVYGGEFESVDEFEGC